MYTEENSTRIAKDVKTFKAESPEKAQKRRNETCRKCVYRCADVDDPKIPYTGGCNYIFIESQMRPCAPSECKKKGIFIKGTKWTKKRR